MAKLNGKIFAQNLWLIITGLLVLVFVGLLLSLLSGGEQLAKRAYDEGRQVAIDFGTGEVMGNPATIAKAPVEETPKAAPAAAELPAVIPDTATQQQQINPALPGNFVGEQLQAQQPPATADATLSSSSSSSEAHEYPYAVPQEPHTRKTSTAAPAENVVITELEASPAGQPLPTAPLDQLEEEITEGVKIPKIGADGTRPWAAYAKPFPRSEEPLVAIIVSGLGQNNATQNAFRLHENFTLALSPYGREVEMWGNQARNAGHEVLVELPMQTESYPAVDPGPQGILTTLNPKENLERLHWVMSRFAGFVGLMPSANAVVPPAVIHNCLNDIAARGLLLVELKQAAANSSAGEKKNESGLISLAINQRIDAEIDAAHIQKKLDELVATAKQNGKAIGLAHAYPLTMQLLQQWQKTLAEQGVRLAPISALAVEAKE